MKTFTYIITVVCAILGVILLIASISNKEIFTDQKTLESLTNLFVFSLISVILLWGSKFIKKYLSNKIS